MVFVGVYRDERLKGLSVDIEVCGAMVMGLERESR